MKSSAIPLQLPRLLLSLFLRALGLLTLAICFLVSLGFAALVHLDLPVARRAAGQIIETALNDTLKGTIRVGSLSRLQGGGLGARDLEVLDPSDRVVLRVEKLETGVNALDILDRVFGDYEKLSIQIAAVQLEGCEVYLLPTEKKDAQGRPLPHPSLQDTFELIAPEEEDVATEPSRPVRIWFPHIELDRVFARGSYGDSPTVEAQLKETRATLLVTDKGVALDINKFSLKASGFGGVDTSAAGEVHIRAPGAVWGNVHGRVGTIPIEQEFRFEDGQFDLKTTPVLEPQAVRPLISEWPLDESVTFQAHAKGNEREFELDALIKSLASRPSSQSASTQVTGQVRPLAEQGATLTVRTDALDLAGFLSELPPSSINSSSEVEVSWKDNQPKVQIKSTIEPGEIDGQSTPAIELVADWSPKGWNIDATAKEKGAHLRLRAEQSAQGPISFVLVIPESSLRQNGRIRELIGPADGSLSGEVRGTLSGDDLNADYELKVRGLRVDGVSVASATIEGNAGINLKEPEKLITRATLSAGRTQYGKIKLDSVRIHQKGPLLSPDLRVAATNAAGLTLEASAQVVASPLTIIDLEAEVTGRGKPLKASVERIYLHDDEIKIEDFFLRSIGEVRGDIALKGGDGTIEATARGLSISRMSRSLGLTDSDFGGELDAKINLRLGQQSEGSVNLSIRDGALQGISGVTLEAETTINDREVVGHFNTGITGLGRVDSKWNARLAGDVRKLSSYRKGTGHFEAQLLGLDLKTLSLLLGDQLPVSSLSGAVDLNLQVDRQSGESFPALEFETTTHKLAASYGSGEDERYVTGLDFNLAVSVPSGGESLGSALRVSDRYGMLASLSGEWQLPLAEWLASPPSEEQLKGELKNTALDLVALIPKRKIERWPSFIPHLFDSGKLSARAAVSGTLERPELGIVLSASRLTGGASVFTEPVDLDLNARYRTSDGTLRGSLVSNRESRRLVSTQFDVNLPLAHLRRAPDPNEPFWTGSLLVELENTPLHLLEALERAQMRGSARGTVQVSRNSLLPQIAAELHLDDLAVAENHLGDAVLQSRSQGSALLTVGEFQDDYGTLNAEVEVDMSGNSLFMAPTGGRPISASLKAQRYDAAVLRPFVTEVFDELRGSLDGSLRAQLLPPQKEGGEWDMNFTGQMNMTDGIVTPASMGLRLTDASLSLHADREGDLNLVRVENISARAHAKTENVTGRGEIYFKGVDLKGGSFELSMERVPFMTGGSKVADLTGSTQGQFMVKDDELKMVVTVNELLAQLADTQSTELIDLTDNPTIEIVQKARLEEGKLTENAASTPVSVQFKVGENVRVKSSLVDVRLSGSPNLRIAEKTQLSGGLQLTRGGRFTVLGRSFVLDQGAVMFDTGDMANPHVHGAATWSAPNGILVRVTISGTVDDLKLEWSSEPSLPGGEADVIALVVGGGGGSDQGGVGMSSLAIAANEAIGASGVNWMDFYATQQKGSGDGAVAAMTEESWSNYTASIRINDELWFEGNYQEGTTGLNLEKRQGVSGTLDWRFHPQWSLRTEVGTLGGGVDMMWQYRY